MDDADGDGVPDDAPSLPMDERRLGSDPRLRDTDGDGLDDRGEALATNGAEQGHDQYWGGDPRRHRGDPRDPDSDGDGLRDGEDPWPLVPFPPEAPRGTPVPDGRLAEGEWRPLAVLEEPGFRAALHVSWDERNLHLAGRCEGAFRAFLLKVDADDDGWYVGRDNLDLRVEPAGAGAGPGWKALGGGVLAASVYEGSRDGVSPYNEDALVPEEGIVFAGSSREGVYEFEIDVARNPGLGLDLEAGEAIGIQAVVVPGGRPWRPGSAGAASFFEPHVFFRFALR